MRNGFGVYNRNFVIGRNLDNTGRLHSISKRAFALFLGEYGRNFARKVGGHGYIVDLKRTAVNGDNRYFESNLVMFGNRLDGSFGTGDKTRHFIVLNGNIVAGKSIGNVALPYFQRKLGIDIDGGAFVYRNVGN